MTDTICNKTISELELDKDSIILWKDIKSFITDKDKIKVSDNNISIGLMCGVEGAFSVSHLGSGSNNHALCIYEDRSGFNLFIKNIINNIYHSYTSDNIDISLLCYGNSDFDSYKDRSTGVPLIPHISNVQCPSSIDEYIRLFENLLLELKDRYNLLTCYGVNNIETFNKRIRDFGSASSHIKRRLVIVDRLDFVYNNDFMGKEVVDEVITYIMELGVRCGIHLLFGISSSSTEIVNSDTMDSFSLKFRISGYNCSNESKNYTFEVLKSVEGLSNDRFIIPYISNNDLHESLL